MFYVHFGSVVKVVLWFECVARNWNLESYLKYTSFSLIFTDWLLTSTLMQVLQAVLAHCSIWQKFCLSKSNCFIWKVALNQKTLENFYYSKINIPNYYLEQKIWKSCLLLRVGNLNNLLRIEIWNNFFGVKVKIFQYLLTLSHL